jgi:glycosyltransferase involved in cell wall biosynthesis
LYNFVKKSSEPLKVVYSGLVSYREHVDLFVKSMPLIQEKIKDVEFYITNKGEDLKKIKQLAKKLNVNPVFFYYPLKEDFQAFLASCDVAVLPSSNDLARQMGTPAKMFEYISVGLPIVANDVGAWTKMIHDKQVGVLTDGSSESFAAGIIKLLSDQQFRSECARNSKLVAQTSYTWDNSAKLLKSIIDFSVQK